MLLLEVVAALILRTHALNDRPMHADEAVQALKFGHFLETGQYSYDPSHFHGPTLYYFTLPVAWLRNQKNLQQIDEYTVRLVSAVIGSGLVLSLFLLRDGLGPIGLLSAGAFFVFSPAMVFYSRYYIQEPLLITFTAGMLACGWRYYQKPKMGWAVATGLFAGLMHATKESYLISWFAVCLAFGLCWIAARKVRHLNPNCIRLSASQSVRHGISALAVTLLVSATFYSSFFTNLQGVWNSWVSPFVYTLESGHEKPFYYYLKMLIGMEGKLGILTSEITIAGLALLAAIASFREDWLSTAAGQFRRFLIYFTLVMFLVYSFVPYKTPWLILSILLGLVLLAGSGLEALYWRSEKLLPRAGLFLIIMSVLAFLCRGALRANFRYYSDARNPYAYVHPGADVLEIAKRIEQMAAFSLSSQEFQVKVMSEEYWPLPWYLRNFPDQVGYWSKVPDYPDASVIIVSTELQGDLGNKLSSKYQFEYRGLRPGVILIVYIEQGLWNRYVRESDRDS